MNTKELVGELRELLGQLEALAGVKPSNALNAFLAQIESESLTFKKQNTSVKSKRVGPTAVKPRTKKDPEAVAKTIGELAARLKANFASDDSFEKTVQAVEDSGLTKEGVVQIYNSVFEVNRTFPKSTTRQALLNALRKDRIAKVRAAS